MVDRLRAPRGARIPFSVEFSPPRDADAEARLWRAVREFERLGPAFVSMTYGAGGSTRDRTVRVTGELAEEVEGLSRFAVMQHLGVLTEAGLVTVRRRGRQRFNHLNPVPLRRWYEQWVEPLADSTAAQILALERHTTKGNRTMTDEASQVRTVRIATEVRFKTTPERLFKALTEETLEWFPHSYGEARTLAVVLEPTVGGRHYEDWGNGEGHLYGHVTVYDPPLHFATRGRIMAGTILDTDYQLTEDGGSTVLAIDKVAFGPMTQDEADSIRIYGDVKQFEEPLRGLVETG